VPSSSRIAMPEGYRVVKTASALSSAWRPSASVAASHTG
jgi:hypothetical protein